MTDTHPKLATPWALTQVPGAAPAGSVEHWSGMTVPTPWPATYGGDLCVGALGAIVRSAAEEQLPHSLQVAFLRPGDRDAAVDYAVERVRDGFRYANRAVRISQHGTEIAAATASLRSPRAAEVTVSPGPATDMRALPDPESLPTAAEAIALRDPLPQGAPESLALDDYWATGRALDTRHIDAPLYGASVAPRTTNRVWVRFQVTDAPQRDLLGSPAGRSALIAYLADDTILEAAAASLGVGWLAPGFFSTTVQQNLWFHEDFDAREWLLFSQRLVSRSGDHVVCQGDLFTRAGTLVATVLQEGIVRVRPHRP